MNAVTTAEVESEVADVRQTTAKRRLESRTKRPRWQSRTTVHDRKDDVRDVGLEALGNKASPRERCPRGQRRRCLVQAVQAWMDSNEKTAREGTPEPKKVKRAQPTAGEKSIPNRRERTGATGEQTQCN